MSKNPSPGSGAAGETRVMTQRIMVVIMGLSGSGKTTVAATLAKRLRWRFEEGDSLRPPSNIARMSRGMALTDEVRTPWLRSIGGRWRSRTKSLARATL
jgi:gluconokinase